MGIPIIMELLATGLVPLFHTALLSAAFMFLRGLSLTTGFILDSVAKVDSKQWELRVNAENDRVLNVGVRGRFPGCRKQEAVIA